VRSPAAAPTDIYFGVRPLGAQPGHGRVARGHLTLWCGLKVGPKWVLMEPSSSTDHFTAFLFSQVRPAISVGLTGFEPATPCSSATGAAALSRCAERCCDLHEHRTCDPRCLSRRDSACPVLSEYLGNIRGTASGPAGRATGFEPHAFSDGRADSTPRRISAQTLPNDLGVARGTSHVLSADYPVRIGTEQTGVSHGLLAPSVPHRAAS